MPLAIFRRASLDGANVVFLAVSAVIAGMQGLASGLINTSQQVGQALGLAVPEHSPSRGYFRRNALMRSA